MSTSERPQVLVFIDWYRPFFKAGGPVRSLVNLVEQLHNEVDFHIVTGDRDYTAATSPADLPKDRWTSGEAGEKVWFCSQEQRSLATWRKLLGQGRWDVIYLNGLYSPWTTAIPLWLTRGTAVRRILAVRGMLARGAMEQGRMKKTIYLRALQGMGCFKGVEFQATSAEEQEDIRRWFGDRQTIHLAPNLARKEKGSAPDPMPKTSGTLRLVSVARIAQEKNTLFAIERLAGILGIVHLDLYGTIYDEAYWRACQDAIAGLPQGITVSWHGHVEQDAVRNAITAAHVLYMPSMGENFGHTLLEALSAGRPLLVSDRTPWKDLEQDHAGWDLPLEQPERFTAALQALVDMDGTTYAAFAQGAFRRGMRYLTDPAPLASNRAMFGA